MLVLNRVTVEVQPVTVDVWTTDADHERPLVSNSRSTSDDVIAAGVSHDRAPDSSVQTSPYDIAPLPHASNRSTGSRKRKSESSTILTSTPHKTYLTDVNAKKRNAPTTEKCRVKKQCPTAKKLFNNESPATRPRPEKMNVNMKESKTKKRLPRVQNRPKPASSTVGTDVSSSDNTPCVVCGKRYNEPPADSWTQCPTCLCWYHDACGPEDTAVCFQCLP